MAKRVGKVLPHDLLEALKKGTHCILATFSDFGVPRTTPLYYIYPKSNETILATIQKDHTSYYDMVWQKKVTLNFLCDNDIAYSVLGRSGVVRAPSLVHPFMNVMRIDVMDVRNDRSILARIERGATILYNSLEAKELSEILMQELKELASTI